MLVGILLGASVVFLFSGLAINAVGRAAGAVVFEVRRQFRDIPGIMQGTGRPEYGKVVDIVTKDSLRELVTPGLLAVLAPVAVGFGLGVTALAGFLAGAIGAGTLMAVFLANSGGAWDNAKKLVEDGHHGGKGSLAHEATIIGDTVGDPFKDTAGPAINPLIKVMNLVSLLIASAVVSMGVGRGPERRAAHRDRPRGGGRDRGCRVRVEASLHPHRRRRRRHPGDDASGGGQRPGPGRNSDRKPGCASLDAGLGARADRPGSDAAVRAARALTSGANWSTRPGPTPRVSDGPGRRHFESQLRGGLDRREQRFPGSRYRNRP